jgi:PA14 domain/Aerotolerance regulator N-terminal/von Willebrand factor type A domain
MLFLNSWLLIGLIAASIPILIHLVRQRAAKPVEWGAMRFLADTLSIRRCQMEWEDLLLMAVRCLLLALLALALARPFIPPNSNIPWLFVLPAFLIGVALFGASFIIGKKTSRWFVRSIAIALFLAAAGLTIFEKFLNLKRFETSGHRDVALVIDASASMELIRDGKTIFQIAIDEAKELVKQSPKGTAFTVTLGGPAPQAQTTTPITHHADVLGILDKLTPTGGSFHACDSLGMATLGLVNGTNISKEIILFTDSQRFGWRFEDPSAWDPLESAWKSMPSSPKLLLRDFGIPRSFHNLAVSNLELSRSLVGTDRELMMHITVENTGTQPITSGPVTMEIGGSKIGELPVGLLVPGQKTTIEFRHRFTKAGPQVVEARIDAKDDLESDDRIAHVLMVRENLPILLVDGNPTGSFFERAAGYSALALAPSTALISGQAAGENFLMKPRVVSASSLREADLDDAAVVVLADVPRLPERLASKLAAKVAEGTGLLVIAGPRAEAKFYNTWEGVDGLLLPTPLGDESTDSAGIAPANSTFAHESLALFLKNTDLKATRINRWRKTGKPVPGGMLAAAYSNGDAFLAIRNYARGRSVLATCAFDTRSGNLPAQKTFVPLVHELVNWLAGGGVEQNVDSSWGPRFALDSNSGGLSSKFFKTNDWKETPLLERIDPAIDFHWSKQQTAPEIPNDGFSVRWTGTLTPPVSGDYLFDAEVDDRIEIEIGGSGPLTAETSSPELGTVHLEAGNPVPIEVTYEQDSGESFARLYWTPPDGKRQIIPSSALNPDRLIEQAPMKVTDPQGMLREATIQTRRRGRELSITGPALPGVYQVSVGHLLDGLIPGIENGTLPFLVKRDPNESKFESITAEDLAFIRNRVDLLQPQSLKDLIGVLQGKGFGREIWRILAVAALVLFLMESILARWVSRSRKTAENVHVEFGETTLWRAEK